MSSFVFGLMERSFVAANEPTEINTILLAIALFYGLLTYSIKPFDWWQHLIS